MKRVVDILGAGVGLLVLSPILILIAVLVWMTLGRPVFFRQLRPGKDGVPFEIVKFRTMKEAVDSEGSPRPDADRLTRLGHFLRSMSLDELPELWNVLKGEMSLVGPRPLRMEYLPRYSSWQFRRHEVKPGITGWAQVNGRNAISWEERFEQDVWYVDHRTFLLDLRILGMTVRKVLKRQDVSPEGASTIRPFEGSQARD